MSAGLTGAGALLQGASQFEAGETRANLFRANAGIAGAQSLSEIQAGNYNANNILLKGQALEGQQRANVGANNLQQAGTPAQVIASTAEINEMDALQTRNNAMRRAWGFQVQETSDNAQAGLAKSSGDLNALGSIIGGGAKAYGQEQAAGSWF